MLWFLTMARFWDRTGPPPLKPPIPINTPMPSDVSKEYFLEDYYREVN